MFANSPKKIFPSSYRFAFLTAALALFTLGFAARGAATGAASAPDMHTFTNTSGASFKAAITGVSGDDVFLKRDDGQTFQPKISIFSKADQSYIRMWAYKRATANGGRAFSLNAVPAKDAVATRQDGQTLTISTWKEYYKVEVKNLTTVNWPSLHFRYIFYKETANAGKLPPKNFTLDKHMGSFDAEKFSKDEDRTFSLDKIDMQETDLVVNLNNPNDYPNGNNNNYPNNYPNGNVISYPNGANKSAADYLKAIWIRVYDDDDNLLQEWASDPNIIKTEKWAFPKAEAPKAAPASPAAEEPAAGAHTGG